MIYLIIFIYILYLSIHFDILEKKGKKWTHYKLVIILLILVAGLRWRIGSDTVIYAQEFTQSHDLSHLEWNDFISIGRMPFWVLLNAICKSIWNDFLLVQFIVAAISISITGHFIKSICPSLCFFILLCYFMGIKYTLLHMELMRESLAISFYLLGILAINKERKKLALIYAFVAIMFHVYALIAIFSFVICQYIFPHNNKLRLCVCICFLILVLISNDILITWMINIIGSILPDKEIYSTILVYSTTEKLGNIEKSLTSNLWIIIQFLSYIFMFNKCKKEYSKYVYLNEKIFDAMFFICMIFLCAQYSFRALYRIGDNYNYFTTCIIAVLFTKSTILTKIKKTQRIFVFLFLLLIPIGYSIKQYASKDPTLNELRLHYYYPYSTVFDKTFNPPRERAHQLRGGGYSPKDDY